MPDRKIADIAEHKPKLFELYTRCRYNELICDELMRGASRVENAVKWSVLGAVAISLVTGSTSYLNPPALAPAWALFSALATFLATYSLVSGTGAKRFDWFGLAVRFRALADEVEFFSEYVKLGKITEDELLTQWQTFGRRLADLLDRGGVELRDYAAKHAEALRDKAATILKDERKAA